MLLCHAMLRTGVRSITSEERLNIWKRALFRSPMSDLVVKELAPSLRDDFLLFFDSVAFADNPDWSDCYCPLYHLQTKEKLRAVARPQAKSRTIGSTDSWPTTTENLLAGVTRPPATATPRSTG